VSIPVQMPMMYPKQYEAIYDPHRFVFIEASTKSGKTHGCILWQIEQVLSTPGVHWWVAPVYNQAKIAFKRAKEYIPDDLYRANNSSKTLTFPNGSVWHFKTAEKVDNLYGEDCESIVLDEASRAREEAFDALRSTLTATQGPMRLIGNTKGRGNWFYKRCQVAKSGSEPEYGYHRLTAYDAVDGGVLPIEEVEAAKRQLPEHVFDALYRAIASEDGTHPFGIGHIRRAVMPELSPLPVKVWGWDVAKSTDWTVGIGLDEHGNMAALKRFQHQTHPYIQQAILQASRETGAPALIDSTGVGDSTLDNILPMLEPNDPPIKGFKFTPRSKQQLMEKLAVALQAGRLGIVEGPVQDELEIFEFVHTRTGVRYEAPSGYGLHDDCVCALALANKALEDFQMWLARLPSRQPSQPSTIHQRIRRRDPGRRNVRSF